jgi:hypothetical protein
MNNNKEYNRLWNKLDDYTEDEIKFLKTYIKKQNYKVNYGFYNKESSSKKQIAVIFDLIPNQTRKTGVENNWNIISSRQITGKEIEEFITFYFRKSFKRFLVFYYKNIDKLIYDDNKLNAITPDNFINECRRKGYSGSYQLKIELI